MERALPVFRWGFIGPSRPEGAVQADSTLESAIDAMSHLGVKRLSIGSRWADEVNQGW